MGSVNEDKRRLRRQALNRRRELSHDQLVQAGDSLATVLSDTISGLRDASQPSQVTVAAYVSMASEIPTIPLLRLMLELDIKSLVPRLGRGLDVGWSELDRISSLQAVPAATTGIRRPDEPSTTAFGPELLRRASLIVLPALGVDRHGTRLGRGSGWYDRALTHRNQNSPIIAVCWPWEVHEHALPHQTHDIGVDAVATSESLEWFAPRETCTVRRATSI